MLHVEDLLRQERGELSDIDKEVARSLAEGATVSANTEESYEEKRTLGERLSDGLATFGGSWPFLICFGLGLLVWIVINSWRDQSAFDPYPYILLNLILSCVAAVQAPIIMMSQRRQEEKDRLRSLNDYQVNLKAELEIRHLHEKLDHLITRRMATARRDPAASDRSFCRRGAEDAFGKSGTGSAKKNACFSRRQRLVHELEFMNYRASSAHAFGRLLAIAFGDRRDGRGPAAPPGSCQTFRPSPVSATASWRGECQRQGEGECAKHRLSFP